jgi:hypothetical protein
MGKAPEFCEADLESNTEAVLPESTECFSDVVFPKGEIAIQ